MKILSAFSLTILAVSAFAEANQFLEKNPFSALIGGLEGAVQTRFGKGVFDMYLVMRDLNNDKICDRLEYWLLEKDMMICRIDYSKMGEFSLELRYIAGREIVGTYFGETKTGVGVRFINNKLVTVTPQNEVMQEIELGIDRVYLKPAH